MSYKNRQKKHEWSGKTIKGQIHIERQYEKKEIKQALDEIEAGDDYRYPSYKASPNPKKKLEGRVKSIENKISYWSRICKLRDNYNHLNWLKSWLYETKKKLEKLINK